MSLTRQLGDVQQTPPIGAGRNRCVLLAHGKRERRLDPVTGDGVVHIGLLLHCPLAGSGSAAPGGALAVQGSGRGPVTWFIQVEVVALDRFAGRRARSLAIGTYGSAVGGDEPLSERASLETGQGLVPGDGKREGFVLFDAARDVAIQPAAVE